MVETIEGEGDGPASRSALSRNCQEPPTNSFSVNFFSLYFSTIKRHSFSSFGNAVDNVRFRVCPNGTLK